MVQVQPQHTGHGLGVLWQGLRNYDTCGRAHGVAAGPSPVLFQLQRSWYSSPPSEPKRLTSRTKVPRGGLHCAMTSSWSGCPGTVTFAKTAAPSVDQGGEEVTHVYLCIPKLGREQQLTTGFPQHNAKHASARTCFSILGYPLHKLPVEGPASHKVTFRRPQRAGPIPAPLLAAVSVTFSGGSSNSPAVGILALMPK